MTEQLLCACGCGQCPPLATRTRPYLGTVKGQPVRWCRGHAPRKNGAGWQERDCGFDSPCWVWTGHIAANGYGKASIRGEKVWAHRAVYQQRVGPIPDGMQIDHLCRNRACVNPGHLEIVSHAENGRRGAATRLTQGDVDAIRTSAEPPRILAPRYGVSRHHIGSIRAGRVWVTP